MKQQAKNNKQDRKQLPNDLPRFNALVEQVRSKKNTVHRNINKGDSKHE